MQMLLPDHKLQLDRKLTRMPDSVDNDSLQTLQPLS
jgi:hypothetical protein